MTINYTNLLGLAKPVTGTETGQWGDVVNDQITELVEDAIANASSISVTSGDVTLTTTTGSSNQARMAVLLITGSPGVSRNIIAPSQSKWYIVKNSSNASIVVKGSATTGVTILADTEALVFWNGSDFEVAGLVGPSSSTDNAVARFDSTTGKVIQNSGVTIDDSNNVSGVAQLNATTADLTNLEVTNIKAKDGTAAASIADSTGKITVTQQMTIDGIEVGQGAGNVATNTAVGASALAANVSGIQNTGLGASALQYQTNNNNTALGYNAMVGVNGSSNGGSNTAVGSNSLAGLTGGNFNTAVGQQALQANTTASNNTAVGYQAGYSNTTGTSIVAIGKTALYNNTGSYNTAVGAPDSGNQSTMGTNTTGAYNTAIGNAALSLNTTGSYNVAQGYQALYSNTTASNNTAVGYQAGYSNTTGTQSVFVGYQAGYLVTGSYNHAFGYGALGGAATTGVQNTAIARFSMNLLTSGSYNVGVGDYTLQNTTTGSNNVAIGLSALQSNTTASNNTAVGYQAGYSNTTGINNVALGYQAGYTSTTSNNSIKIGYQAGYTATGANNICIGVKAGYALTTGVSNTFVGPGVDSVSDGAGSAVTTGSKNTIIGTYSGNQGGLDIRTASNYIVLSDGDGNPRMWANSAAWVIPSGGRLTLNTGAGGAGLGGGVDIRQSSDSGRIDFYNDASATRGVAYFYYNGDEKGSISVSSTATAYNTSSDYRLKHDIQPMTGALAKVVALKPVTYKWNADNSDGEGFIAHELAEVCPHAVTGEKDAMDADGNPVYQGIDVSFLVATLTAAIQELKAEFDAYKATHP